MNRGRPLKVCGIKNEKGALFATGLYMGPHHPGNRRQDEYRPAMKGRGLRSLNDRGLL